MLAPRVTVILATLSDALATATAYSKPGAMSCKVVDWAIQAHGAAGVSQDFWLAEAYAHQRTVRIVDGPDEVHRNAIAKLELAKRAGPKAAH